MTKERRLIFRSVGDHGIYSLCLGRCVDGWRKPPERATAADVGDRRIDIGVGRLSACPLRSAATAMIMPARQ